MNIPEEAVETAAKALQGRDKGFVGEWHEITEGLRDVYRQQSSAALSAAAPVIVRHLADTMPIETLAGADGASVWLREQA